MNASGRNMVISAALLAVFAIVGTAMVAFTHQSTQGIIAAEERKALLRNLNILIPPAMRDNNIVNDTTVVLAPDALGKKPVTIYRARKDGQPVAAVLTTVAPNGYNGAIKIMVGIHVDGQITGVRILAHRETPGLGDAIEREKSDWVESFNGKSLNNPDAAGWNVKRDGGVFDQFTGATITPRAVVKAVQRALVYFQDNRKTVFAPGPSAQQEKPPA